MDPLGARPDARGRRTGAAPFADDRGGGNDGPDQTGRNSSSSTGRAAVAENPVFQHYAEGILEQGRHHGAPILAVKGSIEETIEAAEEHFATELARGPRIETAEERWGLLREANEALAFQVRTGSARPWATWTPETLTRDFICECDEPECRAVLIIPVAEWERLAAEGPVLAHAD